MRYKAVLGVGLNDVDYVVETLIDGVKFMCPFHRKWSQMMHRCYGGYCKGKNKAYSDCVVCDDWLKLSSFKAWMETQDWEGKELDKDLIGNGKIYSPETCIFIDKNVNLFMTCVKSIDNGLLIGVNIHKPTGKFRANCRNFFTGKNEHLGLFTEEFQAHLAWKKRKHELACQLADLQADQRVANALRTRYL